MAKPAYFDSSIATATWAIFLPGSIRYYQAWYRDPAPSYCNAATYNLSNGVRVVW